MLSPAFMSGAQATEPGEDLPAEQEVQPPRAPAAAGAQEQSNLILTEEQRALWIGRLEKGITDLQRDNESWFAELDKFRMFYENDFSYRVKEYGGVFAKRNMSFNLSRTIIKQLSAKLITDFIGSEPFFTTEPEGVRPEMGDRDLASEVKRFAQFKLGKSNLSDCLRENLEWGLVLGQQVVKTAHEHDLRRGKRWATVLVDDQGVPIRLPNGDLIFEDDEFIASRAVQGAFVLRKYPLYQSPKDRKYLRLRVDILNTLYHGPNSAPLHHRAFLCGLQYPCIHKAPLNVHLYDVPVAKLVEQFHHPELLDITKPEMRKSFIWDRFKEFVGLLRENSQAKSPQEQERLGKMETGRSENMYNPVTQVAECYSTEDMEDDGYLEDTFAVYVPAVKKNLFEDYACNMFSEGKRPFSVVRFEPIPGRWTGVSQILSMKGKQHFQDIHLNRVISDNDDSGKIRGIDKSVSSEWENQTPAFGDQKLWELDPGKKLADGFQEITMTPMEDKSWELAQAAGQSMTVGAGFVNPSSSEMLDQPGLGTATVNKIVDRNGEQIYAVFAIEAEKGITNVCWDSLMCLLQKMRPEETYEYLEGEDTMIANLKKRDLSGVRYNIKMVVNRKSVEDNLKKIDTILGMLERFASYPPELRASSKPLFVEQLKALDVQDADKILDSIPVMPPPVEPGKPGAAPAMAAGPVADPAANTEIRNELTPAPQGGA